MKDSAVRDWRLGSFEELIEFHLTDGELRLVEVLSDHCRSEMEF